MLRKKIVIIGGGPAGLAAAIAAYDEGERDLLILERGSSVGGILNQCIHNGFGLHTFKEELTGPEYAQRYADEVCARGIEVKKDTMVVALSEDRTLTCVNESDGLFKVKADAVILACGCRERPRGAINIAGSRCAGIFSAGTAQKLVNIDGLMPGREVVVLGSGDIGLIMARRMTFEGAKVKAVVELMPYSSGLKRNIVQCLDDFDIPLLFSHTVVDIRGKGRVSSVVIAEVDEKLEPVDGTQKEIKCDTLLLSVGLLPENELAKMAGVELSPVTGGAVVDETLMTSKSGIFACGNVLHVHDLVDFVSKESEHAGREAARYVNGGIARGRRVKIETEGGVRYCVPQFADADAAGELELKLRVGNVYKNVRLTATLDGEEIYSAKKAVLAPGEMESINFKADKAELIRKGSVLKVTLKEA